MKPRLSTSLLLVVATLLSSVSCNRAPENQDAVRAALMEHLNKNTGLDMKAMDVDVQNISFQGNQATASVSFKPKSSPDAGMTMNYMLERNGAQWVVKPKAGSAGHSGVAGGTEGAAPPDAGAHAPGATTPPVPGANDLPPGHPPVSGAGGSTKGGTDLPAGHPPVSGQGAQPKTK